MDCPPPVTQQCEVYKDGTKLASVPCTVAFKCSGNAVAKVVLSDVKDAKKLSQELKADKAKVE